MKKPFRLISLLLALCLAAPWLSPVVAAAAAPARAAGAGRTVPVSDSDTFNSAIADLRDGDTIQLTASFVVTTPTSSNDSLFIGKNVTIDGQGHGLSLRYAGVLLGADVTFKNVSLGLASNVRPAIMANGHTLTLDGVTRDPTNRNINLFCGGQTGATQGDLSARSQGDHGHIIIKGNTYLGPTGRVFAGSISTDGTNNEFTKPATVTIDPSVSGDPIGELYACGALQTYTSENDWFDYEREINPPFASPGNFQVRGKVTFNLYQGKVGKVSGDTGVLGNLAQVNYKGTDYLNDNLLLGSIGGLTVESGNLAPVAGQLVQNNVSTADRTSEIVPVSGGSCFVFNNAPLGVAANATLGLKNLDSTVTISDFTGGGILILGKDQTLSISGTVTETTKVAIGYTNFDNTQSTTQPTQGQCYIQAPRSQDGAFTLLPYATQPGMMLIRDDNGNWTVPAQTEETSKLQSLAPEDTRADSGETEILVPLKSTYSGDGLYIEDIPLILRVNGTNASFHEDDTYPYFEVAGLHIYVGDSGNGEELQIYAASSFSDPVPDNVYRIEIVVPGAYTVSGTDLTASFTLTVGDVAPEPVSIPIPQAISGLVWTGAEQVGVNEGTGYTLTGHKATDAGDYAATARLKSGYQWADGSTTDVTIPWRIAEADTPPTTPGDGGSTGGGSSGGNSTGGGSTGGGTSGGGSVGGGSPSGSGTEADTVKNPDGSTTSTKTDKDTGTVTETTTHPDGSTLTVITHPDGPVETTIKQADGLTASLQVNQGSARGEVRLPAQKEDPGAAVALPVPALPGNDTQLSIYTGASLPVWVEIPIEGGTVTTVACFVDRDGTEHIIKTALVEDGKITLSVPDEAVVRFRDGSKSFDDVEKHWAEEDIRFVTSRELFLGTTEATFDPNGSMTRAMLTVVLARLDGVEASGRNAYKEGISWAVDKGISDGRNPGSQVTREQFITMLYRYAGSPAVTDAQLPFGDASSVSGYARDAVCWAVENGILNGFGDGSLRPKDSASRAQAASLLTRYVQYLNQQ